MFLIKKGQVLSEYLIILIIYDKIALSIRNGTNTEKLKHRYSIESSVNNLKELF